MPRIAPHQHRCQDCNVPIECPGTWEQNLDGFPEVTCPEYHMAGGHINPDFVCDECQIKREDAAIAEMRARA